jgi:signal transduction histidine kinase/phage shock protein PspC (stress-responsive transcriptional regulator)
MGSSGPVTTEATAKRRPVRITRSSDGKLVAGVCSGVARALGIDPLVVRVAVVALVLGGGIGVVVYVAGWLLLPQEGGGPSLARAALTDRPHSVVRVLAMGSILLGLLLLGRGSGIWLGDGVVWPVVLAGVGLAVIWRQAGDDERASAFRVVDRLHPAGLDLRGRRVALARVVVGVVMVSGGVGAFLAASSAFDAVRQGVLATAGIVAGLALITGPWLLRLGRDLAQERRRRIRSEERAEVAAHLHDSVLQTLALIQRNADDPRAVVTMARRQERELRGWLYEHEQEPAPGTGDTLVSELKAVAAEVEGMHGVTMEVVAVGDCPLDEHLRAMVRAAREAMVNAAKWSGVTTVSVYAEVRDADARVFVRDWGKGFDPDAVGPDRRGVRESITGRMARHGGEAMVRAVEGEGTEVALRAPREAS